MIASKVSKADLLAAAADVGVMLDMRALNATDSRYRVKVNPDPVQWPSAFTASGKRRAGEKGDVGYQRENALTGRRVNAVCWHGFRDFFRAVYKRNPAAVFRTAIDTWKGSEDFEARYRPSGERNVGSIMYPVCAAGNCRCPERGRCN